MENKNLPDLDNKTVVQTIRETVAKDATSTELDMFLSICKATGLNPFKKEIWFIKTAQGPQIMCGINGYLAVANSHEAFDGMQTELLMKEGKMVGARAIVHRKDRKFPTIAEAYLHEFQRGTPIWQKMPRIMILKCAKALAIREAFVQELGGTYVQEELGHGDVVRAEPIKVPQELMQEPRTEQAQIAYEMGLEADQARRDEAIAEEFTSVPPAERVEESQGGPAQPAKQYRPVSADEYPYAYDISNAGKKFKSALALLKNCGAKFGGKENNNWWFTFDPVDGLADCLVKSPEMGQKKQEMVDDDLPF